MAPRPRQAAPVITAVATLVTANRAESRAAIKKPLDFLRECVEDTPFSLLYMMKTVTPALLLTAALALTGCQPAPHTSPHDAQVEAHLAKIEAHLARIEEALVKQAEANVAQAAQAVQAERAEAAVPAVPHEISVYVYGEAVTDAGEFVTREGATLVTVLAAKGVYGELKPRDVTVTRPGHPDAVLDREEQWKTFAVEAGDVITVRSSVF